MKQIPVSLLTLTAGVLVTLVSLWVGQHYDLLLPEQASEQAPLVDSFFNIMLMIATALFLVVEGAILIFTIQFRKRKGDETDGLPIEGNLPLEAFWTAIPSIIVIGIGIASVAVFQEMGGLNPGNHAGMSHVATSHLDHRGTLVAQMPAETPIAGDMTALLADTEGTSTEAANKNLDYGIGSAQSTPADLVIDVTGMQFAWLFNYPDTGIIAGELHIPVGKDVQLNLAARDVIHSFWVPQFRLKQDAIPGVETELRFVATKVGTYPVVCAELCGSYHGGMRSQVIVHSQEDYDQWLEQNRVTQAQSAPNHPQAVAVNPADMTVSQYLTPYSDEMGIDAEALSQLQTAQ